MSAQVAFAAPFVAALVGAVVSLAADAFGRDRLGMAASAVGLAVGAVIAWGAAATVTPGPVWTVFLVGAGFSMAVGVVMGLGAVSVIASTTAFDTDAGALAGLVAITAVSLGALAASRDILVILLGLEAAAVSGYALVALARTPRSSEAAMKYFIQGAVATALFVFGLAGGVASGALVFEGGRLSFGAQFADLSGATAAIVLVFAALAFKVGAFPFHSWAPDAYETAPPEAAAFLSSAVKIAVLVAMFTVLSSFLTEPSLTGRMQWIIAGVAAASVVFGNVAGLAQRSYTRLLGYSGIAQVGYGLIGVVSGNGSAVLMFATAYGCAAAGAFVATRAYRAINPTWDGSIAGMAGLGRRAPVLSASLAILLFSLTGIPPLFGFWGKFLVFLSAATNPQWLWLVILGLLGSVVSFGYYGRVLRVAYFEEPEESAPGESSFEGAAEPSLEASIDPPGDDEDAPADQGAPFGAARVATGVVVALAAIVVIVGLIPIVSGLARFVGTEPIGLFVINL